MEAPVLHVIWVADSDVILHGIPAILTMLFELLQETHAQMLFIVPTF